MTDKTTILIVADTHINSTVALCPPVIELDDGGTYHASRAQGWIYEHWCEVVNKFRNIEGRKLLIFDGDLGELDTKRRSIQLITINKSTITGMIIDTIEPLITQADGVGFVRGTAAHEGKSSWIEETIAKDTDNAIRYSKSVASWWQMRTECNGVRLDISHHVRGETMGSMENMVKRAALSYLKMQSPLPHLMIRAHIHKWGDTFDNGPIRLITMPCWSLATEYAYRIGRENELADIGALFVTCENGHYLEPEKYKAEPLKGKLWTKI